MIENKHKFARIGSILLALGLTLGTVACGDDGDDDGGTDTDAGGETDAGGDEPTITLTEVTGATFAGPESAHWDAANEVWYIANFGENLDLTGETPDEPCYISRVAADGTVMEERFVEVAEGNFLGMATMGGMLYVAHSGSNLVEIDPADPANPTIIPIPDGMFVNDVAAGGGAVYISDTMANKIYKYTPGGDFETYSEDPLLTGPNGLYV
ncbi:MAG: hypothetical protein AAGC55_19725, partial [Myxococcota bacterium]